MPSIPGARASSSALFGRRAGPSLSGEGALSDSRTPDDGVPGNQPTEVQSPLPPDVFETLVAAWTEILLADWYAHVEEKAHEAA